MSATPPDRWHVVHVDPEMGYSGGEVQVFLLIDGLVERGHRVTVVAQPGSPVEAAARDRGLAVWSVPMRGDWDLAAVSRLTRALRHARPDVVHLHTGRANWLGGWAASKASVLAVSTRRMDRTVKRNWKNRRVYGSWIARTAAISPAVLAQLHAGGVPHERTELIWSVVDPFALHPKTPRSAVRSELGAGAEDFVVLAAGALVERKGFDGLIRAWQAVPAPCRLWIAGEGPLRGSLEQRVGELGLQARVQLLGRRQDMADLLAASDAFAMPSHAEGLGIAALEAMAAGLPVVGARVGGLADLVVPESTGLLLDPGDVPGWSAALTRLAQDPALAHSWGQAGQERVHRQFLPEQMVGAYERFYRTAWLAST
ncbi:MAG: glycosyltransferase family 4 protein [Planctomycetes bacterium]|nr:glycosyltransferase family 4 protein [Planctomycetota bacterium]